MGFLLLLYAVLLVYGSWYPFAWAEAPAPPFMFLQTLPTYLDKGDIVQNVLVYMPFGLLVVAWCSRRLPFTAALLLAAYLMVALTMAVHGFRNPLLVVMGILGTVMLTSFLLSILAATLGFLPGAPA